MIKHPLSIVSLSIISALASPMAAAKDANTEKRLETLEKRLEQLEAELDNKDQQIDELERKQPQSSTAQVEKEGNGPANNEVFDFVERASHRFDAPPKSIYLLDSDTTLQFSGQIWLDAIYTHGDMTNRAAFQPSSISYTDIPAADDTLMSIGQSKFAFRSYTPTKFGAMKTRFEFDLYDPQGNADFDLTHAWAELGNFGAGQTFSGFTDVNAFPNVLDYWGPNAIAFSREPQLRYSLPTTDGNKWMFTLERSSADLAYAVNLDGSTDSDFTAENSIPDATVSYLHNFDRGYIKTAALMRRLGYDTGSESDSTFGWGINISGNYQLDDKNTLKFQGVGGEGIGRYVNDTCCSLYADETGGSDAGLNEDGELEAIGITGAFLYLEHKWAHDLSSSIGYSHVDVDNLESQSDLALNKSSYASANLIWNPTPQSRVGVEFLYGKVQNVAGEEADSARIQTSFAFNY